jgi:hypothetical protein
MYRVGVDQFVHPRRMAIQRKFHRQGASPTAGFLAEPSPVQKWLTVRQCRTAAGAAAAETRDDHTSTELLRAAVVRPAISSLPSVGPGRILDTGALHCVLGFSSKGPSQKVVANCRCDTAWRDGISAPVVTNCA